MLNNVGDCEVRGIGEGGLVRMFDKGWGTMSQGDRFRLYKAFSIHKSVTDQSDDSKFRRTHSPGESCRASVSRTCKSVAKTFNQ